MGKGCTTAPPWEDVSGSGWVAYLLVLGNHSRKVLAQCFDRVFIVFVKAQSFSVEMVCCITDAVNCLTTMLSYAMNHVSIDML